MELAFALHCYAGDPVLNGYCCKGYISIILLTE